MSAAPVTLGNLGLRYRMEVEKSHTLKEYALRMWRGRNAHRELWAIRELDLSIRHGEALGVIGRNGSGKSTLLKLVAGVLRPTEGERHVRGRVAALIDLGAGFRLELTGRENVFLGGALLGRSRREMEERYDSIVAFSELGEFMDVPVKNYSSGMYMRLGFAIATDVDPDILLLDEVLAVGDEAFQGKCRDRIGGFLGTGKTVMFVSHDLGAVREICTRVIVLSHGKLVYDGAPGDAIGCYQRLLETEDGVADAAAPA